MGFAAALEAFEPGTFPTLERAIREQVPAYTTKIEWVHNGGQFANYTEINRTPWTFDETLLASRLYERRTDEDVTLDNLRRHLAHVEQVLLFGSPLQPNGWKEPGACGGVYHFLGRAPRETDRLILRPLRDLRLKFDVGPRDQDGITNEWLCEYSLQVMA